MSILFITGILLIILIPFILLSSIELEYKFDCPDEKCTNCEHDTWDCICDPPCNIECKCQRCYKTTICQACLNDPCDCAGKHE